MNLYIDMIEESDFHNAWAAAVQMVLMNGTEINIGGADHKKPIKDSCILISLTGKAIEQIEKREIHPQFPFRTIDEYCKEFTWKFYAEYRHKPENEKFAYLYYERLSVYPSGILQDQLTALEMLLSNQKYHSVTSNRDQAITWVPEKDMGVTSPPCLQRIQIRYIPKNKVDIHLTWRSRDLYTAWQANVIAIVDMLNREVIKPNDCKIVRVVDYNDSLHIYKTDVEEARKVKLVYSL